MTLDTHTAIFGSSQTGKTTLLHSLALDLIYERSSVVLFDFYDEAKQILQHVRPKLRTTVTYIDFSDTDRPVSLNPLSQVDEDQASKITNLLLDALHGVYPSEGATVRLDRFFRNAARAMLAIDGGNMLGMYALLTSESYRE